MDAYAQSMNPPGALPPPPTDGDETLFVKFYMGSIKDEELSATEGHPIFRAVPFVKIMVPGDKNTVIDTFVSEQHKRRFARLWAQFERNEEQVLQGMPIREWPAITRAQADELYYLNIVTVEQLASLADVYGTRIMGFNEMKRKAITFLQLAKDSAIPLKLAEENAVLKQMVETLQDDLKKLSKRFEDSQNERHGS